jgi:UDP-glucose 4-epimerase
MKKVIVTGGAGFIGSHVVEALILGGHKVTVLDNLSTGRLENISEFIDGIDFFDCNISVAGDWAELFDGVDWVIHLAALADIVPSIQRPEEYFHSNVDGTFNVLQAARKYKAKRFIYAASSSCYGIPDIYPTPETSDIKPQYPYALTKNIGEQIVMHWASIYDLPAVSLRFFNVYGTRSRTTGTYGAVFGVFLAQKLANQPFTIVGNGEQTRDFTYVSDIADAVICAAQSTKIGEIYNVGSGSTVSVNRIANLLEGDVIYIPKRPGEPDSTFADISKIRAELGWQPKIAIEDGVKKVLDNIGYWMNAPVWTPDSIDKATQDWFKYLGKT